MKKNYYKNIIKVLEQLHKAHPTYGIGKHFATALSDYTDIWSVSDKEIYEALLSYQFLLSSETQGDITEEYIDNIIKDAQDLSHILDEEEED